MPAYCNSTNSDLQEATDFWSGGDIVWDAHRIGWVVCGAAAVLTVIISLVNIILHATHYHSPGLQRQTIRIILMPPVYGVVSFFSYRYFREYTYYSVSETSYEAVTLSAFLLLMLGMVGARQERARREREMDGEEGTLVPTYGGPDLKQSDPNSAGLAAGTFMDAKSLNGPGTGSGSGLKKSAAKREAERQAVLEVMRDKEKRKMPFPFNFWRFRPSKPYFMYSLKWSVLQYVILRPLLSIIAIICEYYNVLCPQTYSIHFAEVYLDAVDFVSISVALYGLIIFYMVTRSELQGRKPLAKFMAIKLIVFFTFYQTWLFGLLQDHGVIKGTATWTATNVTDGLSALCTSIEMILFSLYMLWAYPYKEFTDPVITPQRPQGWKTAGMAVVDTINLWDMFQEVGKSFTFFWRWLRREPGTRAGEMDGRTEFDQVFVPDHAPSAYAYDANNPSASKSRSPEQYNAYQGNNQDPYAYPPAPGYTQSSPDQGGYSNSPVPHGAQVTTSGHDANSPGTTAFPVARPFPSMRHPGSAHSMTFSSRQDHDRERDKGGSAGSAGLREASGAGSRGRTDSYSRLRGAEPEGNLSNPRGGIPREWRDGQRDSGRVNMPLAEPIAVQAGPTQAYPSSGLFTQTAQTRRDSWNPPIESPVMSSGGGHYQRRRDV